MSSYTDSRSGIVFPNVKDDNLGFEMGPIVVNDQKGVDPNFGGVINAIDIDWNDVKLGTETIRTTGDLIKYIDTLQKTVAVLSNNVGTLLGWIN